MSGRRIAAVQVLNHEGRRMEGRTLSVTDRSFALDTGRDKTFYFEVVFAD